MKEHALGLKLTIEKATLHNGIGLFVFLLQEKTHTKSNGCEQNNR